MDAEMRQLKFLLYVSLGCTTIFAVLTIKWNMWVEKTIITVL